MNCQHVCIPSYEQTVVRAPISQCDTSDFPGSEIKEEDPASDDYQEESCEEEGVEDDEVVEPEELTNTHVPISPLNLTNAEQIYPSNSLYGSQKPHTQQRYIDTT